GLAVEVVALGILDVDQDRVVLGRPATTAAGAVVVGPDQLVQEALAAEDLVQQQLDVVRLAIVEVDVERAAVVQQAAGLAQPRLEEAQVVVEVVPVGGALPQLAAVPPAAEPDTAALGVGDGGE